MKYIGTVSLGLLSKLLQLFRSMESDASSSNFNGSTFRQVNPNCL